MKKKLVGLLLTAAMLATALAGCGNGNSSSSDNGGAQILARGIQQQSQTREKEQTMMWRTGSIRM